MAIDTAEKRKNVAGLPFCLFLGVTPNASPDAEWRQQAGWGYSGIPAGDVAPPLVIGTVPIYYVVGTVPNVVPVETVGAMAAGVVPVREFPAGPNIVPVREAASETPRVKVCLV